MSECKDLRALSGILDSLKSEGFVLPFSTRKQLCSQLLRRALNANSIVEAQILVDYAKCIVDFSFHALREAMFKLGFGKSSNEKMLYVVEEKICSSIFDQDRLLEEVVPDNDFEKRIRPEVIPTGKIGVKFDDIGALENVKDSLQELVMLPLRRPDLFKGGLLKPCKGILLFGPPGTGKTMLAKALATEANASFINVSMSTITSKWFGEDEKNVRALFPLAAKVSPTIIFIDEVDSMLGQRSRVGEHEAMRKIKNEFMAHWDGLLSKTAERVLVLAATNRTFDLDEAIIRRFQRRIMVGLPNAESRERILRTLLAKEKLEEGFDFKELATMTDGYTDSDLKNLCTAAAFQPVQDFLKTEQQKEKAKKKEEEKKEEEKKEEATKEEEKKEEVEEAVITLRPLTMEDLKQAKSQISPSFAYEGVGMNELKEWNEMYGEGGSRKKQSPTYFL